MSHGRLLSIVASVVVAATLVAAITVMDTPAQQREQRVDSRRVDDLQNIGNAVDAYHARNGALPADIGVVMSQPGWNLAAADPVDGQPYAYEILGERSYRLCASFATDTADGGQASLVIDAWKHGAGRQCFKREAPPPASATPR